jgi:hypothetical protein
MLSWVRECIVRRWKPCGVNRTFRRSLAVSRNCKLAKAWNCRLPWIPFERHSGSLRVHRDLSSRHSASSDGRSAGIVRLVGPAPFARSSRAVVGYDSKAAGVDSSVTRKSPPLCRKFIVAICHLRPALGDRVASQPSCHVYHQREYSLCLGGAWLESGPNSSGDAREAS